MDSLKEFQVSGPEWGHGCEHCEYGLIAAPAPVPALDLSECRAGQAAEDLLHFCDCRAGFMYRQFLRKVYAKLSMAARQNIHEHVTAAMPVPTVHGVTP